MLVLLKKKKDDLTNEGDQKLNNLEKGISILEGQHHKLLKQFVFLIFTYFFKI